MTPPQIWIDATEPSAGRQLWGMTLVERQVREMALRGGVHFLMQVDMPAVVERAEERFVDDMRRILREAKVRYQTVSRRAQGGIEIRFRDSAERAKARAPIAGEIRDLDLVEGEDADGPYLLGRLSQQGINERQSAAIEQNMTSLRNRVNELGVAEPIIQQQGQERIVVQLPGVQDTAEAKRILGRTATLEIKLVDEENDVASAIAGRAPPGSQLYKQRDGRPILLKKRLIYSGDNIVDASPSFDSRTNEPIVSITLDSAGAATSAVCEASTDGSSTTSGTGSSASTTASGSCSLVAVGLT